MGAPDMHTENDDAGAEHEEVAPAEAASSLSMAVVQSTLITTANPAADNAADESFTDMITRTTNTMLTHSNNILAAREALLHIATLTQASCLHTELPINLDKASRVIVVLEQYMEYLKAVCITYFYH